MISYQRFLDVLLKAWVLRGMHDTVDISQGLYYKFFRGIAAEFPVDMADKLYCFKVVPRGQEGGPC